MSTQFLHQQKLIVPERIIPGQTPVYVFQKHISRYEFATAYVSGKTVLEIGCGHGYGTFYLAQHADNVLGIDVASEVINEASQQFWVNFANDQYASFSTEYHPGSFSARLFTAG